MTITIDMKLPLTEGPVFLRFPHMDSDEFFDLCQTNPNLSLELTAKGEVVVMPPVDALSDSSNAETVRQLGNWNVDSGELGLTFGPSAGFKLANGATRSPDASWVSHARWNAIPKSLRAPFPPVCPEFVVEVLSPSDSLIATQAKMDEYLANGARLGWLIDCKNRRVFVYRPEQAVQELTDPAEVSGDPELPGFVLSLRRIFGP